MSDPSFTPESRRATFRALHTEGCFVLPNPWDIGSARYLHSLGFKALASTSSGVAWSLGRADGQLSLDDTLAHLHDLAAATPLPVNADFGDGFGTDAASIDAAVTRAIATGVAGISIEDASADPDQPLRSIDDAVTRLRAYASAGADCLYAPGITTREQIEAVVAAVAPKPVNLLVGSALPFTLQDIAAMGVRRVSVGGAMARTAWGGLMRAARQIHDEGRFDGFADAASGAALNQLFH